MPITLAVERVIGQNSAT